MNRYESANHLFDHAPIPMAEASLETRLFTRANRAFEQLIGYSEEELTQLDVDTIIYRDDQALSNAQIDSIVSGRSSGYRSEKTYVCKDGTLVPVSVRVVRVDGSGGLRALAAITDASEQRRLEMRLETALQVSNAIVWRADASGGYSERQPAWTQFTGQAWPEHKGFGWAAMIHPDDRQRVVTGWQKAASQPAAFSDRAQIWNQGDQAYHRCAVQAAPMFDVSGRIVEWVGSIVDVEDLTRAEDRLRSREDELASQVERLDQLYRTQRAAEEELELRNAEFEALADNMPALCWIATGDGAITWYNRRWYEYTGTDAEEMRGWGWTQVHDPAVLPDVNRRWTESLRTGREFEMTFPLRGWDGIFRPFLTRVVPIRDEAGEIIRWFGTNTDVDALKRTEEELRVRTAELETLLTTAPIGLAYFDRGHHYLRVNRELARMNGLDEHSHIGRPVRDLMPDSAGRLEAEIDQVFASGKPGREIEVSVPVRTQPGLLRHWLAGFFPVRANGETVAVGAWVIEISDRKAAEDRERLLAREVDHRAKNLLAVVQSIVQLSRDDRGDGLRPAIVGRIQALARAHSLLADARWDGVALAQLASEELAPYVSVGDDRIHISGPDMLLRSSAAQSVGLVLHELATNAVKYGALALPTGSLDVHWEVAGDMVEFTWAEHGARDVRPPSQVGFGTTMIRASVERQLRGKLDYDWREDGAVITMRMPSEHLLSEAEG